MSNVININGAIENDSTDFIGINHPIFKNADFLIEKLRINKGSIVLWEDHYFNLMASMRILRMNIPLDFTPEFFKDEIYKLTNSLELSDAEIAFYVFRNQTDLLKSTIGFVVKAEKIKDGNWEWVDENTEIEVYKDFYVNTSFFSTVNTPAFEEVVAKVFALENDYGELILLNAQKRMARTLKGSIFLVNEETIRTPKIEEGVKRSVLRESFIKKLKKSAHFKIEETEIFPFEIQKADELFVLIEGKGIHSIHKNRKKTYHTHITKQLFSYLEEIY